MVKDSGTFVISLDFELMWGVRDVVSKETYGEHILGVHTVIPRLLNCFQRYNIRATFATVGFLYCQDKNEINCFLPAKIPDYSDANLSPYGTYLQNVVGDGYSDDPYHFGWPLVQMIQKTPGQELGTHTFSHYYCLEPGQTSEDFKYDLECAIRLAESKNIAIKTIIFPRNQVNEEYLELCRQHNITSYRHNELSWLYEARSYKNESYLRRMFRLLDSYANISGHHCYLDSYMASSYPYNIPSSRFLRPFSKKLKWFEWLRLKRITHSMTYAAKNKCCYHLWWHPHNFGINQDENFAFLEKILQHYQYLNKKYSFASLNMGEVSQRLESTYGK